VIKVSGGSVQGLWSGVFVEDLVSLSLVVGRNFEIMVIMS